MNAAEAESNSALQPTNRPVTRLAWATRAPGRLAAELGRYGSGRRVHGLVFAGALLIVSGCTSPQGFVPNAGRTYAPCDGIGQCAEVIRDVISSNWVKPSPTRDRQSYRVILDVELGDDTTVVKVMVEEPSGSVEFDESAVAAVWRAGDFSELRGLDPAVFRRHFRKFKLDFDPAGQM